MTLRLSLGLFTVVGEDEADLVRRYELMRERLPPGVVDAVPLEEQDETANRHPADVLERLERFAALGVGELIGSRAGLFALPDPPMLDLLADRVLPAAKALEGAARGGDRGAGRRRSPCTGRGSGGPGAASRVPRPAEIPDVRRTLLAALADGVLIRCSRRSNWRVRGGLPRPMSPTTLALAASPSGMRSRVAWRVALAFVGSWMALGSRSSIGCP